MQDKNKAAVKNILLAIAEHKKVDKLRGLTQLLQINERTLYAWIKRGKIGNVASILKIFPYLNIDWLETGKGQMMVIDKDNFHLLSQAQQEENNVSSRANIVARIEPGNQRVKEILTTSQKSAKEEQQGDKQPSVSEMMEMTKIVLGSNTVYRSALASNVRAFYKAVVNEGEMEMLRDEIAEIRQTNKEMKESQLRIEEMLRSLGAVEQKRESAA